MKLSLIIPTLWRIERATPLFERILDDMRRGDELIVATDADGARAFKKKFKTKRFVCFETDTEGYWRCMNECLDIVRNKTFLWTADDILPRDNWLDLARDAFETYFPDGLGVVGMNDLHVRDATCGHAISTPDFLYVLFGKPRFPEAFRHLYLDTLIADRAKSVGRYHFCYQSITEHMHYQIGKSQPDRLNARNGGAGDKDIKDSLDIQWKNWERQAALERMKELNPEWSVVKNEGVPVGFRPVPSPTVARVEGSPHYESKIPHVQSVGQTRQSKGKQ